MTVPLETIPLSDFGPGWGDEPNPDTQNKRVFMARHDTSVILKNSSGKQAISIDEYKEREAKKRDEGIVDVPITVDEYVKDYEDTRHELKTKRDSSTIGRTTSRSPPRPWQAIRQSTKSKWVKPNLTNSKRSDSRGRARRSPSARERNRSDSRNRYDISIKREASESRRSRSRSQGRTAVVASSSRDMSHSNRSEAKETVVDETVFNCMIKKVTDLTAENAELKSKLSTISENYLNLIQSVLQGPGHKNTLQIKTEPDPGTSSSTTTNPTSKETNFTRLCFLHSRLNSSRLRGENTEYIEMEISLMPQECKDEFKRAVEKD
jgi:hypothetical protein